MTPAGFPHSDISGSKSARDSPELFAACHVLLRLLAPRHPPRALKILFSGLLCCQSHDAELTPTPLLELNPAYRANPSPRHRGNDWGR